MVEEGAAGAGSGGGRAGELLGDGSCDTGHCDVGMEEPRSRPLRQWLVEDDGYPIRNRWSSVCGGEEEEEKMEMEGRGMI